MSDKIKVLALAGKAGAGKDKILQEILDLRPDLHEIISCTSRPPRAGEQNGINYYFYSYEDFEEKVKNKEMLESTIFNGWYYGTSLDGIDTAAINVGVFNTTGIKSLYNNPNIDLQVFQIWANDKTRLLRQLNREPNPNVEEIIRRYGADKSDFLDFDQNYIGSYTIVHNNVEGQTAAVAASIIANLGAWLDKKE